MPPKRTRATSTAASGPAKKPKTSAAASAATAAAAPPAAPKGRKAPVAPKAPKAPKAPAAPKAPKTPKAPNVPKSNRWSTVSASANIDAEFKLAVQDPVKAYAWICICPPSWIKLNAWDSEEEDDSDVELYPLESDDEDDDSDAEPDPFDEDADDDDEDSEAAGKAHRKSKTKCDNGKTCLCHKPAQDHPEHEWVITYAGFRKWVAQLSMGPVRCPDVFDMYTYNDHEGYGILEVLENLFLDFAEASSWKEQWVVCEGLVLFGLGPGSGFNMVDDSDRAYSVAELIGRLFLTMLARLEREQLLEDPNPEVRNLGLVMTLYIKLASDLRDASLLERDDEETVKKSSPRFKFKPSNFDEYILAYANKFAITLRGLKDVDRLVAEVNTDAKLPSSGQDPWDWDGAFKAYSKLNAVSPPIGRGKATIGGDNLDITSWSSVERKQYSFNKKDPLTKKDIDALKSGMVMQLM